MTREKEMYSEKHSGMGMKWTKKEISGIIFHGHVYVNEDGEDQVYGIKTTINGKAAYVVEAGKYGGFEINEGMKNTDSIKSFVQPLVDAFEEEILKFQAKFSPGLNKKYLKLLWWSLYSLIES